MTLQLILYGLVIIGGVVVVHEIGHYFAARIFKIKVENLSIGFGPSLTLMTLKNGTKVSLGAIPLGGFNKLCDDDNPKVQGKCYSDAGYLEQLGVILAGPIANFILAFVLFFASVFITAEKVEHSPVIISTSSLFQLQEFNSGDTILAIDDVNISTWKEVISLWLNTSGNHKIRVRRSTGKVVNLDSSLEPSMNIRYPEQVGIVTHYSSIRPCVKVVIPDSLADRIGVKPLDCIISINGNKTENPVDVFLAIEEREATAPLKVSVSNNDIVRQLEYIPSKTSVKNPQFGVIINMDEIYSDLDFSFIDSITKSWHSLIEYSNRTIGAVVKLLAGELPLKNLASIYSVGKFGSVFVDINGISAFFTYTALISIALAVFNLMPLYVLDGGQAIAVTYSALTKKAIKPLAEQLLTKLSFIVLIGIGFIAIYNDLAAIKG